MPDGHLTADEEIVFALWAMLVHGLARARGVSAVTITTEDVVARLHEPDGLVDMPRHAEGGLPSSDPDTRDQLGGRRPK